jgi:hypothetical protein
VEGMMTIFMSIIGVFVSSIVGAMGIIVFVHSFSYGFGAIIVGLVISLAFLTPLAMTIALIKEFK